MNTENKFIGKQHEFAAHIRDPEQNPKPADIEDRRMAIYRDLFYNNVENFLASGYPVLRAITDDEIWHRRVRRFFADHHSQTPYFAKISEEFLNWLQTERGNHPDDPPFILELAHYEWVELALSISDEDKPLPQIDTNGDVFEQTPVVSPVAWHLAYRYPVHQITKDFQPQDPGEQPTYLVVYRNRQDRIHFLEINAVTYRLLDLLKQNPDWTGHDAVTKVVEELNHPQPETVRQHGRALLDDLRQRNIIIGTQVA